MCKATREEAPKTDYKTQEDTQSNSEEESFYDYIDIGLMSRNQTNIQIKQPPADFDYGSLEAFMDPEICLIKTMYE